MSVFNDEFKKVLFGQFAREIDIGKMTLICLVEKVEKGDYGAKVTLNFSLIDQSGKMEVAVAKEVIDVGRKLTLAGFDQLFKITVG